MLNKNIPEDRRIHELQTLARNKLISSKDISKIDSDILNIIAKEKPNQNK